MGKKYFGVMLDMSRNAVMNLDSLKSFAKTIAKMGYNMIQLYTEDTFEVEGEPFFGYMRGRYSIKELKDFDAYCKDLGIELIPCVQTLAHLKTIFHWPEYCPINDIGDIMLIGEERTYKLIENIFATLQKTFSTDKVHIGMDEAEMFGLGRYLHLHGIKDRFTILKEHLDRVTAIAKKYGFNCMIWSDMFFKLGNNGEYYLKDGVKYDPTRAKECAPKDLGLVYWDYYHETQKEYDDMIDAHKSITDNVWFAGGIWTWLGYAPSNKLSLKRMIPAMQSCRKKGVDKVMLTSWGDNGGECSKFTTLPVLYYLKKVYDGETDENKIKQGFYELTGEKFDDMMSLDLPNDICSAPVDVLNPSRYMLFSDPLLGFMDANIPDGGAEDYEKFAKKLLELSNNSKNYSYLFLSLSALCDFLCVKYDLGLKLRTAYQKGDKAALKDCVSLLDLALEKLDKFYYAYKTQWYKENKPHGFDVQDIRLGGLMRRLKTAQESVSAYLDGKMAKIEELEEVLLDFFGKSKIEKKSICYNRWTDMASANPL